MSDLQDMDTSDLEGMDEEESDSQPSDNEPQPPVTDAQPSDNKPQPPVTDAQPSDNKPQPPVTDAQPSDNKHFTGDIGLGGGASALNTVRVKTDTRHVRTQMAAVDTHKTVAKTSNSKDKISVSSASDRDQKKRDAKSNEHTKYNLDGKLDKSEYRSEVQPKSTDNKNSLKKQAHQQIDIEAAKKMTIQMHGTKLKDTPDKNCPDPKRARLDNRSLELNTNKHSSEKANVIQEFDTNAASVKPLHYGTEQESVVFAGQLEELMIDDEQTELTSLEIPATTRGSISVKETGDDVTVLDHDEERDIVRARSYSDSVAAAYFDAAIGSMSKPHDQVAGPYQLAERKDIMFHVGYEELKTETLSDLDLKQANIEQVTNLDEVNDSEVDKVMGASKTDQLPYDEVDAMLPGPVTDGPDNFNPCKRESKVKWDDNIFLVIADKEDNILIDDPVLSKNWKEDEETFEWHMKHEPVISQTWKEEIIQRNLRDLPDDASLEVNPPSLRMTTDEFCSDIITESKTSDINEGLISDFSFSLTDRILADVLETLSSTFSQISGKERTSNIEDDITSGGTENSFKIDESQIDSSSKLPEVYSCDSYSDFCRELEASDSGYKASVGVSFEDNEDSTSFDDKPDEFPKIEILEPGEFDKVSPDEFEKFIHQRLQKDDNLKRGQSETQAETNPSEIESKQIEVDDSELKRIAEANVVDVLEPESLSSLEYHQGVVLNTGLSEDQEYHEIMAALANEEYRMDDQGFIAGTAQDYGLVPGSDIEDGAASLEYCDWAISEDDCK